MLNYLEKETNRISRELIIIGRRRNNKSLIELYEMLLDKKYSEYYCEILMKVVRILSDNNYEIIDINNFKLKHFK